MKIKKYPAKLLLFGEYSIINNSLALALPYHSLYGHWEKGCSNSKNEKAIKSNEFLKKISAYINSLSTNHSLISDINNSKFTSDCNEGLWFNSNIPIGYGMGSSGALCAAIYDTYSYNKSKDCEILLKQLAQLEGFFHGTSSGVDPLVSYLNQTVLIHENKRVEVINNINPELKKGSGAIFLIDSGISRQTTQLVEAYLFDCKSIDFLNNFVYPMKKEVAYAIDSFLNNQSSLFEIVSSISKLEFNYMQKMIPKEFQAVWKIGLDRGDYVLKLCGAGGGGFILGFARNRDIISAHFSSYPTKVVYEI
jgi:mevalonate kinase